VPPNPSELLESERALELLESLRAAHDIVIIDAPPIHPVADAAVLARVFGGAVLVVGAGRARERDVRRATARLASVGATIHGVVLNLARPTRADRRSYSTYSVVPESGRRGRGRSSGAPDAAAPGARRPGASADAADPVVAEVLHLRSPDDAVGRRQ